MSVGFQSTVHVGRLSGAGEGEGELEAGSMAGFGFGTETEEKLKRRATKHDKDKDGKHVWGRFRTPAMTEDIKDGTQANIGWTTLIWVNEWPCDSIYGLAVAVNLLHNTNSSKIEKSQFGSRRRAVWFENVLVYFPYWLLLYANIFAQLSIVWFVRQIATATDETCSKTSYILQLICSMVYTAKIWVDLWQSFKMTLYLRWLPSLRPGKEWMLGITQVVLDKDENIVDFARDSPLLDDDDCHGYGVYRRTRWLMYLLVIFPKVFIGIVLWYHGLFFLVTSETDADLLLNAVALLFVLEIDEFIAELVPESTREQVGMFPEYKLSAKDFFAEFAPHPDPVKRAAGFNVLGNKMRNKNHWCAWANLSDPVFFWSTYGHWIPPIFMMVGIVVGARVICADYGS